VDGVGAAASNVVGESADDIAEAIIEEPTMQALSVLTPEQVQLIADFLETVVPVAPAPAAGVNLYATECESCHGPNGIGGTASNVVGESADDIAEAILEIPDMQAIVLSPEDIQLIADFLASSATLGVTGTPRLGTTPVTPRLSSGTSPKGTPAASNSTKTTASGGATDALFAALLVGSALGAATLRRRRRYKRQ
jgi:mono/diheme cytochrome c family protein